MSVGAEFDGVLPHGDLADRGPEEPRIIHCEEHGPVDIPLSEVLDGKDRLNLNPEIESGDYFAVSLRQGVLTLRARGYVGYLPLNNRVVVYVRPRVPISNLSRLTRIAGELPTVLTSLRGYETADEWNDGLIDVYAAALIDHVKMVSMAGLLKDYQERQTLSSFPHGRVLTSRTIHTLIPRGIKHAAYISWHERTADNAVNRCLKYAVWCIAQQYTARSSLGQKARKLHRALNALYPVFDGVQLDHSHRFVSDPLVTGAHRLPALRVYYRDALNVALAAISQRAVLIDNTDGGVRLPSLVINMNKIFEGYIRNTLASYAAEASWCLEVRDGNWNPEPLFHDAAEPDATPDIVLVRSDGTAALILEVKNVPKTDRDAINQGITYAVSFGTRCVALVHPCSANQSSGMELLGTAGNIAVYRYRIDLGAQDLFLEEARFGAAVARLVEDLG